MTTNVAELSQQLIHFHVLGTKVNVIIRMLKVKCSDDQDYRAHLGSL